MKQFKEIQKQIEKETDLREQRAIPIAHMMLEEFVKSGVSLKTFNLPDVLKEYQPIYEKVVEKGKEEEWLINDILYAIKLFMRLVENFKNVFELSLEENQDKAIEKIIGKKLTKLTVKDVDDMLKK